MKRYFLLCLLFLGLYTARGQEGSLDATFAGTGWAPLNFATSGNAYNDYGRQLLVQSDGKYIVLVETSYYHVLARYTAEGVLDKSFGTNGFSYPIDLGYVASAVVQADDKIVVGGYAYNNSTGRIDLALERYTSNGVVDASFGSGGVATAEFASYYLTEAHGLAVQSTGEIIAVGQGMDNNYDNRAFVVARFTGTGALDNTFNSGGTLVLDFSTYSAMAATAVALQGNNILVAGEGVDPATGQLAFTLVRLLNGGTVDGSFGTEGWVRTSFASTAYLTALALQPDQRIVAGGYSYNTTAQDNDFALARYTSDGVLEGTGTTDLGAEDIAYGLVVGSGPIVQVGYRETFTPAYHKDIALVRYTGSGALDESFDGDGKVITTIEGDDEARGIVLLADGSLLVAGNSFTTSSNTADVLLARYRTDGTLDNTFNATGTTPGISFSYYSHGIQAEVRDMVVQPDGKLVVAGYSAKDLYSSYTYVFGVARFNRDGTLDASFGQDGVVVVDFGNSAGASSVALQPDGKIVVGGSVGYYPDQGPWEADFALVRLTGEGVLDPTFDGDGKAVIDFYSNDYLSDIAVQPDGKIIGAGASFDEYNPGGGYNSSDFAVVRFTPDGKADRRFGNGGLVTTDFFGDYDHVGSVALQPDGRILVSGLVYRPDPVIPDTYLSDFAVVRYNSNGMLDTRFGTGGKALANMGSAQGLGYLALQVDGKIVVGGALQDPVNSTADFALVRFTPAGLPDAGFGGDGVVTTDIGGAGDYAGPVVLQSDGKILQVGGYYDDQYNSYFAVVRYLNDGTHDGELDASFDGDGRAAVSFPGAALSGAMAWHGDRVYITGYWQMPDLAVAAAELPPSFFESAFVAALQATSATAPLPVISMADVTVAEGQEAELTITLSRAAPSAITVNYATQDGTAASKGKRSDYKSARSFVTIEAGATSAAIRIPTTLNGPGDDGQYFYVNLSLGVRMEGMAIIGDGQAKVTIEEGGLIVEPLANKAAPAEPVAGALSATVYPNPASGHFTLQLHSGNAAAVTIRVTDAGGRVVEAKTGVAANGTLQLGSNYRPGVYYIHVQQGSEKQSLKVVKQAP